MKISVMVMILAIVMLIPGVVLYLKNKDDDVNSNIGTQILIASGLLFGFGFLFYFNIIRNELVVTTRLFGIPVGWGYRKRTY